MGEEGAVLPRPATWHDILDDVRGLVDSLRAVEIGQLKLEEINRVGESSCAAKLYDEARRGYVLYAISSGDSIE